MKTRALFAKNCINDEPRQEKQIVERLTSRSTPLRSEAAMLKTSLLKALSAFALAAMLLAVAGCARPQSTFVPAPLHSLRGRYLGLLRQPVLWSWAKQRVFERFSERFTLKARSSAISYDLSGIEANPAKFNCQIFSSGGFWLTYHRPHNHVGSASAYILTNGRFEETFH